jgi:hypothetical protein
MGGGEERSNPGEGEGQGDEAESDPGGAKRLDGFTIRTGEGGADVTVTHPAEAGRGGSMERRAAGVEE